MSENNSSQIKDCDMCNYPFWTNSDRKICNECKGNVPLDELKELVDEWETSRLPRAGSYHSAAYELQEIIEQYE